MPRAKSDTAKSSVELDAEIREMRKKIAAKQKAARAAKNREKAEADRAKAVEEAQFNREFVDKAKQIYLSDYEDNGQTIYELIRAIIRPAVPQEPVQAMGEAEQYVSSPDGGEGPPFEDVSDQDAAPLLIPYIG